VLSRFLFSFAVPPPPYCSWFLQVAVFFQTSFSFFPPDTHSLERCNFIVDASLTAPFFPSLRRPVFFHPLNPPRKLEFEDRSFPSRHYLTVNGAVWSSFYVPSLPPYKKPSRWMRFLPPFFCFRPDCFRTNLRGKWCLLRFQRVFLFAPHFLIFFSTLPFSVSRVSA